MERKSDRVWASLLPGLGLLIGFVYFWSNNVTYFTGQSYLFSCLLLSMLGAFLFCLCNWAIFWGIEMYVPKTYRNILYALIISVIFSVSSTWIVNYDVLYQRRLWSFLLFILSFILLIRGMGKMIVIFLSVILFISGSNFIYKYIMLQYKQHKIFSEISYKYQNLNFVRKPNIYIFWLESYQGLERLRSVFNMDVDDFEKFLLGHNFHIEDNIYSSGSHTLMSMEQLYATRRIPGISHIAEVSESLWWARELIGGSEYNYVYRMLKENGYRTYFIIDSMQQYYFNEKGKYLDEVAFSIPLIYRFFSPILTFVYPSLRNMLRWEQIEGMRTEEPINGYTHDNLINMKHAIMRAKKSGKPYIISFKGGAFHTFEYGYNWMKRYDWISSGNYQNEIAKSNKDTEEIVSYIIRQDPDSIIIILGDHGPYTYAGLPYQDKTIYAREGITVEEFMKDFFNVFFAWRMPGGADYDLSRGMYMNNVNLFTHIFAWMADDEDILKERMRAESDFGPLSVIEGHIEDELNR